MKIKPPKEPPLPDVEVTLVLTGAEYTKIKMAAQMMFGGSVPAWFRSQIKSGMECDHGEFASLRKYVANKYSDNSGGTVLPFPA